MATVNDAASAEMSSSRFQPRPHGLRTANLPDLASPDAKPTDAHAISLSWITAFNEKLKTFNRGLGSFAESPIFWDHFLAEFYWRDMLCLTWDFHTLHNQRGLANLFGKFKNRCRIQSLGLDETSALRSPTAESNEEGQVVTVQAFLYITTDVGSGTGIVKLKPIDGTWRAFTLFTCLTELRGHEELVGKGRPHGGDYSIKRNWYDCRLYEEAFEVESPAVLILGAGQAGLAIAARLKMLGVKSLIVERESRVGDNWRARYDQLFLHGPVWLNHMPYLPFPESWPIFTPKDKFADWLECYAKTLELNIWTRTIIKSSSWNDETATWTIELLWEDLLEPETLPNPIEVRQRKIRVLHPKHVIQATGHGSELYIPDNLDLRAFQGNPILHSARFKTSQPAHGESKRAIVVGACNSAHDIAQNYYENGYSVTMIQRSSTFVISSQANVNSLAPLYGQDSPATEDSDILMLGIPNPVIKRMNIDSTKLQQETVDKELLAGLDRAGFKHNSGPDGSGLWITYLERGGGFCIDTGCSQLIIDGKIKVKQGRIDKILVDGLKLTNGESLGAEEIVFATGYKGNMRDECRNLFGDEVADRVEDVWGFDQSGEIRIVWRKSGHPGFWFMGGNLILCRFYSKALALQIKALLEGICQYEDL